MLAATLAAFSVSRWSTSHKWSTSSAAPPTVMTETTAATIAVAPARVSRRKFRTVRLRALWAVAIVCSDSNEALV